MKKPLTIKDIIAHLQTMPPDMHHDKETKTTDKEIWYANRIC